MRKQDWIKVAIVSLGGLLLILGLFWLGNTKDLFIVDYIKDTNVTKAKKAELEGMISSYETGSNKPEEFSLLGTDLASAQTTGMIQKSTLSYLNQRLEDAYKNHVYYLSEQYVKNGYKDKSTYIDNLIQLEKSIGNNPEIKKFKEQIEKVYYYQHEYPSSVDKYLSEREEILQRHWNYIGLSKWEFPTDEVESIKYRLNNTQGLDSKYKSFTITRANNILIQKLEKFENDYKKYLVEYRIDSIQRSNKNKFNW